MSVSMRLLVPLLGVLSVLHAQTPPPPVIHTTLLPVAIDRPLQDCFYRHGDKAVSLVAGLSDLGAPMEYRGPQRLVLHASAAACLENPPVTPPLAVVDLPADSDRVLLLAFHPQGQPLRFAAYDVPMDGLRPGDYRFFNFSSQDLAVRLGEERFPLARGADRVVSRSDWREEIQDLNIQLASRTQGEARLVFSSFWGHYPTKRSFVLLFDGAHASMPVVMRKMHDQVPSAGP